MATLKSYRSLYIPVLLVLAAALSACGVTSRQAVSNKLEDAGKITVVCPEARLYLPDFPSFNDRQAFFNDSLQYRRGMAVRDTERGRQAVLDARTDLDFYLQRFGAALGVKLSEKETPAIAKYIQTTYKFARAGISTAKSSFARRRPYSHFKESSAIAVDENSVGEFTSYPSGHTVRAWSIAMALVAIDEAHYSGIVKVGLELGESRVITGFHYASDVEYGRISASVAFAKLVSDPEYVKLMNLARRELEALRRDAGQRDSSVDIH